MTCESTRKKKMFRNIFRIHSLILQSFFNFIFCYPFFRYLLYKTDTTCIVYKNESCSFVTTSFKLVDRDCLSKCLFAMIDSVSPRKRSDSPHLPRRRLPQVELSFSRHQEARQQRSVCDEYIHTYSLCRWNPQCCFTPGSSDVHRTVMSLHGDS